MVHEMILPSHSASRTRAGSMAFAFKALGVAALIFSTSAPALAQDSAPQMTVERDPTIWPVVESAVPKDPEIEKKIDALLAKMTLEEKVGQTIQAEIHSISLEEITKYHIGSVLNGGGSYPTKDAKGAFLSWVAAANAFYDASVDPKNGRTAIPILWGTDAVHGHNNIVGATLYPHNIGLGATNDPDLIREIGAATARAVRATGIPWAFAPTVAVARDERWGRTYESYSEDPALVARLGRAMVEGLQGTPADATFLVADRVIATAKHFIGDGGTLGGDDQGDTVMSEADLFKLHGLGYVSTLEAGVQTVMASFNSWNGDKLHGHRYLLTDVLKNRMGFDGFVVGDWNGHEQIPGCTVGSCAQVINAGVDMVMAPINWKDFYRSTLAHVKKGTISEARLDDAVRRILRVKFRAGLFEGKRPSEHPLAGVEAVLGHAVHRDLARRAVRQSLVLLKNEPAVLPIAAHDRHVLVVGSAAESIPMQAGGWSVTWQGRDLDNSYFPGATNLWSGIEAAVKAAGGKAEYSPKGSYKKRPDVAIVVFGETPYAEFEGDRTDSIAFKDGGDSLALLKKLQADGIPTVAVMMSGRPMWVGDHLKAADAFVAAWLPGTEGGGVADVLIADENGAPRFDFTGRLSFSWPARPDQMPVNAGDLDETPAYPLGFGLSYP
ncbi:lysosomal beta glucosidase [alpha proteobacterium Q-1]|nr:lysosomal beta glucosidase [alpha proteobacterium Q-1]